MESWKLGKLKNSKLRLAKERFQSLKYARRFWSFESFIFWFFVYSCHTCCSFKLNCRLAHLSLLSTLGGPLELIHRFVSSALALVLFISAPFCSCSSLWFKQLWTVHHATEQRAKILCNFHFFTSSLTLSGVQGFCSRWSLENGCAFWRSWRHFHLRLFLHPNERQSQAGWMRERQCDVNCQSVTTLWAAALCIQIWLLYMYWFIPFRFASFSFSTLASQLLV